MKFAVIGAGFTGIAAAYDLASAGHDTSLFEASNSAGGLASGFKAPGWDWYLEKYYHHWFASDEDMKQLLTDTGLISKVFYRKPTTAVYYNEAFYPLDSLEAILKFPGFKFSEKIRFALITAYLKYLSSWSSLEKHQAVPWLTRHYGLAPYRLVWEPMLQGKFGPYYETVTMAWMWARLKARTPSLGSYQGGFQMCANDLLSVLKSKGVKLHLGMPVGKLVKKSNGISLTSRRNFTFDSVLLTTPPLVSQKLAPFLPKPYLGQIIEKPYLSAVVLVLALTKPLSHKGYYWYNLPKNQDFPFLSLVEHTNFIDKKNYGGDHLIYCGDYIPPNHPYLTMKNQDLIKTFIPGIKKINPLFNPSWIRKSWVFKADYAQPVPGANHSQLIPPIQSPVKGLYVANMAQVYPWDRGTNFAIEIGRRAASIMLLS